MRERHVLLVLGDYQPAIHQGVAAHAAKHWWQLEVAGLHGLAVPKHWEGDGLIVAFHGRPDALLLAQNALKRKTPIVALDLSFPELPIPRVVGDHVAIGRLAAEQLLERGHRRFAWYCEKQVQSGLLRAQGFESALQAAGHAMVALPAQLRSAKAGPSLLEAQLKQLCAGGPLAIFAYNDAQAATVMHAALRAGLRIPEDVALIGVDDDSLAGGALPISLSSVRHDLEGIGSHGARVLGQWMDGKKPQPDLVECVPPLGVSVRRSTSGSAFSNSKIALAEAFLQANLAQKLNLEDVARAAGLSPRATDQLFRSTLGHSVHDEVLRLRIRQAVSLLENTNQPVKTVAQQCGFCTHAYLVYALRRELGKTPTEIRKGREVGKPKG